MTNTKRNTSCIDTHNKVLAEQKAKDVHNAINKLRKEGQFTLADLCREAGVSRSYFTKHPEMRALADKYIKSTGRTVVRSQDSKDTLIQTLKRENAKLTKLNEKFVKEAKSNDNYKEKYEKAQEEIKALKKELEEAYANCLPLF